MLQKTLSLSKATFRWMKQNADMSNPNKNTRETRERGRTDLLAFFFGIISDPYKKKLRIFF